MGKTPTREELERQLRANQEAMQERAMANLLEAVEFLSDRAKSAYYEPTPKEREDFAKIRAIIADIGKRF